MSAATTGTQENEKADPCSFANTHEALVTHSHLEFSADFDTKLIESYVRLSITIQSDNATTLCVDTRDLTIKGCFLHSAEDAATPLKFELAEPHAALGTKLTVHLPPGLAKGAAVEVGVHSCTAASCTAVQFLDPAQTAQGTHPYLFSQCQAIHARSLFPCQDTPSAKMTYDATVWVPEGLTALMSAVPGHQPQKPAFAALPKPPNAKPFHFRQTVRIPSYLVAIAAGLLEARDIGPRSRVWSEPAMVDAGAYEFADTEKFLQAGEAVAGPYVWGRYDILLLPPSFPYGGMENPCLTFVTPTLLAGDRSQANVVAHEIAHSWTGNLVTNRTWEHFWLNEGCTVFLERKILGRLHGQAMFDFHAVGGWRDLQDSVREFGPDHPFTALIPNLQAGADPDDAFSKVPYEKGFSFLAYLQNVVGGSAAFEPFFAAYIQQFANDTVDSHQFRAFFEEHFAGVPAAKGVDWEAWLHAPGLPPVENHFDMSLSERSAALADKWHFADVMGLGLGADFEAGPGSDLEGWSGEQKVAFLESLLERRVATPLASSTCALMDDLYSLSASNNSEIKLNWYLLCVAAGYKAILPYVAAFLKQQGRMKYLRPLYRALHRTDMGRDTALTTFSECKESYHPIAKKMVAQDLQVSV